MYNKVGCIEYQFNMHAAINEVDLKTHIQTVRVFQCTKHILTTTYISMQSQRPQWCACVIFQQIKPVTSNRQLFIGLVQT